MKSPVIHTTGKKKKRENRNINIILDPLFVESKYFSFQSGKIVTTVNNYYGKRKTGWKTQMTTTPHTHTIN